MSDEFLTMLGVGIALGLFNWRINAGTERRLARRIDRLADDVRSLAGDQRSLAGEISELRERIARLEGLLQGFVRGENRADLPAAK